MSTPMFVKFPLYSSPSSSLTVAMMLCKKDEYGGSIVCNMHSHDLERPLPDAIQVEFQQFQWDRKRRVMMVVDCVTPCKAVGCDWIFKEVVHSSIQCAQQGCVIGNNISADDQFPHLLMTRHMDLEFRPCGCPG